MVWLYENFQNIVKLIHEDIKQSIKNINSQGNFAEGKNKKGTGYCGILWHMTNCPIFEELFCNESNMDDILSILSLLDEIPPEYFVKNLGEN